MSKNEIIKIYRDNVERVYRYFYKRSFSREVSEDLTSESFHLLLENLSTKAKSPDIQNSSSYIMGIAKHLWLAYLRKKYSENLTMIEDWDSVADESSEQQFSDETETEISYDEVLETRLLDIIPKLPDAMREIITLRFVNKLSLTEICKEMNKDMNYVKVTQRRAIAKIRELAETTKG